MTTRQKWDLNTLRQYTLLTLGTASSFEWTHAIYAHSDEDAIERAKMAVEMFENCQWFMGVNLYRHDEMNNQTTVATLRLEKRVVGVEYAQVPRRSTLDRVLLALKNGGYSETGITKAHFVKNVSSDGSEKKWLSKEMHAVEYLDDEHEGGIGTGFVYVWTGKDGQVVGDF